MQHLLFQARVGRFDQTEAVQNAKLLLH